MTAQPDLVERHCVWVIFVVLSFRLLSDRSRPLALSTFKVVGHGVVDADLEFGFVFLDSAQWDALDLTKTERDWRGRATVPRDIQEVGNLWKGVVTLLSD